LSFRREETLRSKRRGKSGIVTGPEEKRGNLTLRAEGWKDLRPEGKGGGKDKVWGEEGDQFARIKTHVLVGKKGNIIKSG